MKIITQAIYEHTTVEEYTPSKDELYWWYGGTHAGLDPKNPYALRKTRITETTMRKLDANR